MSEEPEQEGRPCNDQFIERVHSVIDYMRSEWNMTYSEVVGCLECLKWDILEEMKGESEDEGC